MAAVSSTDFIDALSRPEAYPHAPSRVDVVQTHISIVCLAGPLVFKVKKAVDLGFLDFTRLADRRRFCEEEVRLNSRLAPEVYLGVAEIAREPDGRVRIGSPGAPGASHSSDRDVIDYAVVMKRLPEDGMMNHRLERGEIDNAMLDDLATILVDFHRRCRTGEDVNQHARPEALRRQIEDNFAGIEPREKNGTGTISAGLHGFLKDRLVRFVREHVSLLDSRIAEGRIREGHGDLHSRNICIVDPAAWRRMHDAAASAVGSGDAGVAPPRDDARPHIVIYDCIEFSEAFRCRDVACELAFLAMDLDFNGYRGFSGFLAHRYAERAGDDDLHALTSFYKAHFAVVRGKVESLRSMEDEVEATDRREARSLARAYFHLAAGYLLPPCLIVMSGLPGTGKSHVAGRLARPLEAEVLRSDVIRKRLAGVPPTQRAPAEGSENVYTEDATRRTYREMERRARTALRDGRHVIIDATMPSRAMRRPFLAIGEESGAPVVVVETTAPDDVVRERMRAREDDRREVSDADWDVYLKAKERFERPEEAKRRVVVGADDDVDRAVGRVIESLMPADA